MHEVLVNCLVKLAQEKSVVRGTNHLDMTIAVKLYVKPQTKQTNNNKLLGQKEILHFIEILTSSPLKY